MKDYHTKGYDSSVSIFPNAVQVTKVTRSNYCFIVSKNHDKTVATIELHNKEMVEHLHFMLGQILKTLDNPFE